MKVEKIAFAGADDRTPVKELLKITEECPQVEWGVLLSRKRQGMPQYASWNWIESAMDLGLPLSGHLCGSYVDDMIAGNVNFLGNYWMTQFRRFQINFARIPRRPCLSFYEQLQQLGSWEWIFQCDSINDFLLSEAVLIHLLLYIQRIM